MKKWNAGMIIPFRKDTGSCDRQQNEPRFLVYN